MFPSLLNLTAITVSSPIRVDGSLLISTGTVTLAAGLQVTQNLSVSGGTLVVAQGEINGSLSVSLLTPSERTRRTAALCCLDLVGFKLHSPRRFGLR